ncbi:hypothetical protein SSP35_21_00160 [Streptomyces sp. NBRC 110611]|nr:hypothetical protein SSP35_21_00160 [Streptomyces sp. NBRC 110611]
MEQNTEVVARESTAEVMSVADPQSGQIRLLSDRCRSCILNPAEYRLPIPPDRLREFLTRVREANGHVVCHRTLPDWAPTGVKPAMCRGFIDTYGLPHAVRAALAMGAGHLAEQHDFP